MINFTIPGTLPGLNEYVGACRAHARKGAAVSAEAHTLCKLGMMRIKGKSIKRGHFIFRWYEKSRRRDKDNIAFAKKFIMDSLQEWGVMQNDGWDQVIGFIDEFYIDRKNPRVEVLIFEEEDAYGQSI
jgi:Holliday junction resolvase RusA-like endonuclease